VTDGFFTESLRFTLPLDAIEAGRVGLYPPNEENKARYEAWASTVR